MYKFLNKHKLIKDLHNLEEANLPDNAVMFNGWDADIIIPDLKVAILWNGPWHYIEISKTQKLKQVQNRDRIKLREIINCGYRPYIIEDVKREKNKVEKEFKTFIKRYCSDF